MALLRAKPGLIWHIDLDSQYASESHRKIIKTHKIKQSKSGKGWDNTVAESFFHTFKVELTYHYHFKTKQQPMAVIFEYIEVFCNHKRLA